MTFADLIDLTPVFTGSWFEHPVSIVSTDDGYFVLYPEQGEYEPCFFGPCEPPVDDGGTYVDWVVDPCTPA